LKTTKKNILVAPLNWGLGHATRCIPIIRELIKHNYNPLIASDGQSLELLKKEFPNLIHLELPSYHIEYAQKAENFKWKIIKNSPKTLNAILKEKRTVKRWLKDFNLHGIISDNRVGVYSKKIPSVIITHQLNVLSGKTTWLSSKFHQFFIKNFSVCWVPDCNSKYNYTGKLGHLKDHNLNIKYIGTLSRLEKKELPNRYDLMVLLSGPEPQRTILEKTLLKELIEFDGKVIFINGVIENEQKKEHTENVIIYNFMTSDELELALNESKIILCRSGYTTIMDLVQLEKKAFFIPTPGQYEQEYLAERFMKNNLLPFAKQDDFSIELLKTVDFYPGFPKAKENIDWKKLFDLFESE
jgi:uncharacterized protein (TIGR00661 family)